MAKNKYVNGILPMFLINFAIGSVYCWTLFKEHIWDQFGLPPGSYRWPVTEWSFSLAIFFLGLSAAFGGRLVERNPRRSAFLTFIFITAGWFVTAFAVQMRISWLVVVGFGVIQGIGLGLGYITPVKTMMVWMPNTKGFAAGLSIAAFGLAGVLINPLIGALLNFMPVYGAFYTLAIIFSIATFVASRLLWRPPYVEDNPVITGDFSVKRVVFEGKFVFLWLVFFLNIVAGLALISQEKQVYRAVGEIIGDMPTDNFIVLLAAITAIGNLVGRLGLASLQDKLQTKHLPYYFMAFCSLATLLTMALIPIGLMPAFVMIFIVQFFLGAGFSCMPNILHQNWGMKYLSTVHGLILTAWAAAGLAGNQLSAFMLANFGLRPLFVVLFSIYAIETVMLFIWVAVRKRNRVEQVEEGPLVPVNNALLESDQALVAG
ncbi:MAG: MFS transporter [Promicromonosporaceae bacterium]|nr:MFS transporter [Promicromonosporaceae bacterium]